jgi:hypothetical protein
MSIPILLGKIVASTPQTVAWSIGAVAVTFSFKLGS